MTFPSWRVWVPTGVAGAAVAALLAVLTTGPGPAVAVPPAAASVAAQSITGCTAPVVPAPAAATDYFLKLDGIPGGSTDARHPGDISISSFAWGINPDPAACGPALPGGSTGGGAGKAKFSDIRFVKTVDRSSPKLAEAAATGKHFPSAVLTARRAGRTQSQFLVITLSEVSISSYSIGASSGALPQDTFGLAYTQIRYEYFPQRQDGSLDSPVTACFDLAANKTC